MRYFIYRVYGNESSARHYYAINDKGEGFYVLISSPNRAHRANAHDCRFVLESYTLINRCKLHKMWKHPIITEMP